MSTDGRETFTIRVALCRDDVFCREIRAYSVTSAFNTALRIISDDGRIGDVRGGWVRRQSRCAERLNTKKNDPLRESGPVKKTQ